MQLLTAAGLKPLQVKKMIIKNKKFKDHCTFIVYFLKKDGIKIAELREIKVLSNIRVRWEFYQNRRQGPIQCSNCMKFGHGGKNCQLDPRCIRCSEKHKSIECLLIINQHSMSTRTRIADSLLKCANCGQNHTANYSKCTSRIEIIERQKKYRIKTQPRKHRFNLPQIPQFDDSNFPRLNTTGNTSKFAQDTSTGAIPKNNNIPSMRDILVASNDLFSPREMMEIFKEMWSKMQGAKTKLDQINIIGELVVKYAFSC
jgi:hypothetical protein